MNLSAHEINSLKEISAKIRREVIKELAEAGSGHTAGSLSVVEFLTCLYFKVLKHDPKDPYLLNRDRFILSNGHTCPALYATLALAGYFPQEELKSLRQLGSRLQGHPQRELLPGIETTSGPLGCGLSQACGMALAAKMDKSLWRVVCLMSDAEQEEGNIWEAVMFANKYKLNNLTAVIDQNNIEIDGKVKDVMPLLSLKEKYRSFGWKVLEVNGHDYQEICRAFVQAKAILSKPTVIIARTTAGKGVSFMEGRFEWHGKVPSKEEAQKVLEELDLRNVK